MPQQAEQWTYQQVLDHFNEVKSEQTATILGRRNPGVTILGVRFGDIDKVAKRIKRDSDLARRLWESGIFEARIVAVRVLDPASLTEEEIDRWVEEIDYPTLADEFAGMVYQTPFAEAKRETWTRSPREFVRRAGFHLVYSFAADPKSDVPDRRFRAFLEQIRAEIHDSPNWSREVMNMVPIAIGKRGEALFGPALEAATAYGTVDVFHGDKTNCKVWDAAAALADPRTKVKAPA
ncbi:MAG: DNA alkylation repair protein [Thermomicrobiales bacterium]